MSNDDLSIILTEAAEQLVTSSSGSENIDPQELQKIIIGDISSCHRGDEQWALWAADLENNKEMSRLT
jgi:hypothetical protein